MNSTAIGSALTECVVPLDEDGRRALRRYWERVIWEEWVPPEARRSRPLSVPGEGRRRREARRAMARVAAAGRLAPVVALRVSSAAVAGSGVAA